MGITFKVSRGLRKMAETNTLKPLGSTAGLGIGGKNGLRL
jgi:hypothetical protein